MFSDRSMLSCEGLPPTTDSDKYRHSQANSGWGLETLKEEDEELHRKTNRLNYPELLGLSESNTSTKEHTVA